MTPWSLRKRDLKSYPHFDPIVPIEVAEAYALDPVRVAKHNFYPFLLYQQRWNRFAKKGERGKEKKRPIRYAARQDAYIFSRYRHDLSARYEAELARLGIADSVLAYRRLVDPTTRGGRCNIHFARDAFAKIAEIGDCCVVALDISSYFESLDHTLLRSIWCRLLGLRRLPDDHQKVYEAITRYSTVDKQATFERLGYYGEKRKSKSGKPINGYLVPNNKMPRQLCTGKIFREKIIGLAGQKSLIRQNKKPFGIPQGAPISDLLANFYLLDFDHQAATWARQMGGAYLRYSDDILLVVPGDDQAGARLMAQVRSEITRFGTKIVIKESKSSRFVYRRASVGQSFVHTYGTQGRNGLEYLGFRYNGNSAYIRDSTLSSLRRKVIYAARREANILARRYPNKTLGELQPLFDYNGLIERFGKVEDFKELSHQYRRWTFWTYVLKASKVFGKSGKTILGQMKHHRKLVRRCADREIERAVFERDKRGQLNRASAGGTVSLP